VVWSRNPGRSRRGWVWIGHLAVGALCFFLGIMILRSVAPPSPEVLLPGTALIVQLTKPLSSRDARLGEVFEARLNSVQNTSGDTPLPPSVRLEGRCVAVRPGEGDGRPGYLRLALSGMWDPQGHFFAIETTTISLSAKAPAQPDKSPDKSKVSVSASFAPTEAANATVATNRSADVVLTPEANLTFVLLSPAIIPGHRWTP